MNIELLAFSDCPSQEEAYARLRTVLTELGRPDVEIVVRWIETDEEAVRMGFVGSPTFRWQGRDLLPPGPGEPVGLACRVYRRRDGRISPLPDPEDLREAVARALASASVLVYKLVSEQEWRAARAAGEFTGSAVDLADGYVHFSTVEQVVETAARHFAGQRGIVLVAVDAERLGDDLRWEASRGGALFPHLYGRLPMSAVVSETVLPDDTPVGAAVAAALAA